MKDSSKYLAGLYMTAIQDKIDKISNGDIMTKQETLNIILDELEKPYNNESEYYNTARTEMLIKSLHLHGIGYTHKKLIKFLARALRKDSNGLFAERYRLNALSKEYTNLLYNNKKTMNDIKSIYDIVFNEYECDMSVIDNIDVPKSELVYTHKENHNTKPRRNYRYPKYYNKINA